MKTVTYNDVLYRAAELAGRTRDKVPVSEAAMLRGFLAAELMEVWNVAAWPDLTENPEQVTVSDRSFSKREGAANEMGDILGVTTADPRTTTKFRNVSFEEGDGEVKIDAALSSVWVEWQTPA